MNQNRQSLSFRIFPLWHYIKKYRKHFSLGMLFLLITNALDVAYPLLMKRALDQISAGVTWIEVAKTCLIFFAVMGSLAVTRFCWRYFFGHYHIYSAEDLRRRLFQQLTQLSPEYFTQKQTGDLMSIMTSDVQSFRMAIGAGVLILVDGLTIMAMVLPIMISMNWDWTWKTLILLPLVPFIIYRVNTLIQKRYRLQQDRLSDLSSFSQESVMGVRITKSFAQEENRLSRYKIWNKKYVEACNQTAVVDALFGPVMQFGVASGTVILLFLVAGELTAGLVTVGTFIAFQRYITKMVWPMTALGLGLSQLQKGRTSFARINEVLKETAHLPFMGDQKLSKFSELCFDQVSFSYPKSERQILSEVSFKITAGETLAIVGPVASGKSTLLQLAAGLYHPQSGNILINQLKLEEYSQESFYDRIILVPQEAFLFSESILDNLKSEKSPLTETSIETTLRDVDVFTEMHTLPQGLETKLGERGVNLSGGQKQRLAIARGLQAAGDLYLFDDVLSAVDEKTERHIQGVLAKLKSTGLAFMISTHRLQTLNFVDRVLVLNQGKIEFIGTPKEALNHSPTLIQMAAQQQWQPQQESK